MQRPSCKAAWAAVRTACLALKQKDGDAARFRSTGTRIREAMNQRMWDDVKGAYRDGLDADSDVVYSPLSEVLLPTPWHKGRVVLVGDAVHATTPHLGQGGGMAIEDAKVDTTKLDADRFGVIIGSGRSLQDRDES